MSNDASLKLSSLLPGLASLEHDLRLKVGVLEGATNEDGEKVADYAAMNEFGTATIPARPAMCRTLDEGGMEWLEALSWNIMTGKEPEKALKELGKVVRGAMVKKIRSWKFPPNAPSTVRQKLKKYNVGDAPLYETGAYAGAIGYEVVKE